jgi:hypothetical protein
MSYSVRWPSMGFKHDASVVVFVNDTAQDTCVIKNCQDRESLRIGNRSDKTDAAAAPLSLISFNVRSGRRSTGASSNYIRRPRQRTRCADGPLI